MDIVMCSHGGELAIVSDRWDLARRKSCQTWLRWLGNTSDVQPRLRASSAPSRKLGCSTTI
eukprot:scaffold103088_cov31-Tisochrysis_lutea.AAC.1